MSSNVHHKQHTIAQNDISTFDAHEASANAPSTLLASHLTCSATALRRGPLAHRVPPCISLFPLFLLALCNGTRAVAVLVVLLLAAPLHACTTLVGAFARAAAVGISLAGAGSLEGLSCTQGRKLGGGSMNDLLNGLN